MKICFLSLNLFMHGGIQRVAPGIINPMVEKHDITVVMPYEKGNGSNIFGLSNKVKIKNLLEFPKHDKRTLKGFVALALCKTNMRWRYLDNRIGTSISRKIVFSKQQKEALIEYFNSNQFDVIIAVTEYYSLLLAMIAPQLNAATIGWQHNTFESYFEMKKRNSYGLKKLCLEEFRHLNRIFVLTNEDRSKFSKYFGVRTEAVYNPVSFEKIESEPDINSDLLFVGRLYEYQKGLDYLVEIMKKIVTLKPECRIKVVGDGIDRSKLEDQIKKNGLSAHMQLVGMKSNVAEYYEKASLFLHTSRYEGFGVVLVEAMAFGVPVVAFHNNGPDEIITNDENGILIDRFDTDRFASCVVELLNNPEKYALFSKKAKERAADFCAQQIVKEFEKNMFDTYEKYYGDFKNG